MAELILRPDVSRPGWYVLDEARFMSTDPTQWHLSVRSHVWRPPTDMYETDEAIVVRVEIAGMREQDFSIQLEGRYLSIRGTRPDQPERRAYHQMEIRLGEFVTEVELPCQVLASQIDATYSNGFLRMVLPKARPQKIQVGE